MDRERAVWKIIVVWSVLTKSGMKVKRKEQSREVLINSTF